MTETAMQNGANGGVPGNAILPLLGHRSIVLVGMMGVGKSSIGRRLGTRLGVPFVDADGDLLALDHLADLRLLVIGDDPDIGQRHD